MKDRVDASHLKTPHFIELAEHDQVSESAWITEYFKHYEEACQRVEWLKEKGFVYMQVEVGTYKTKNGSCIRDYMYRHWNTDAYIAFLPARSGSIGVPHQALSRHEEYTPYLPE